jgi:hypothetical protein
MLTTFVRRSAATVLIDDYLEEKRDLQEQYGDCIVLYEIGTPALGT